MPGRHSGSQPNKHPIDFHAGGSYLSSPDQPSTVYPDRLIRPLPKRSIRSRLSQEAADQIAFPPNIPSTSLPNFNGYGENGEYSNDSKVLIQQNGDICSHDHDYDCEHYDVDHDEDHCPHHHCHHNGGDDLDSGEDVSPTAVRRANGYRVSPRSPRSSRHNRYGSNTKLSPSGPDGYDAFENTNNKKKRKIPTSGGLGLHHSSLSAELAQLGLSSSKDGAGGDVGQHYAGAGSGLGVQGAGRGRNSRRFSGRNPLGVSMNGSNARAVAPRHEQATAALRDEEIKSDQGIISAAIANATALLRKPLGKGQENVGVLDQAKQPPANSEFTFKYESDSKGVKFPEQSLYSPGYQQRTTAMPAPATPASQKVSAQGAHAAPTAAGSTQPSAASQQTTSQNNTQGKKPRRRRGDIYALAARQRKLQQEYANLHHPPEPEDIWICEFCEYESIFGVQPHALIRQYEIKDRKERRRLAEKRRLLEKAKLKGRKGKKQTRGAAKTTNHAGQQPANQQGYDQSFDQLGDDYLDDGYDDDPIPMPAPQAPSKQPMPGAFHTGDQRGSGGPEKGGVR